MPRSAVRHEVPRGTPGAGKDREPNQPLLRYALLFVPLVEAFAARGAAPLRSRSVDEVF